MKFTAAEDYSSASHIWTPITYAQAVNKVSSSLREKGQRSSQNNKNVEHVKQQQQQRFGVLEKLDFGWKRRLTLEDRLAQLADYRKNNGDCNVPCQFEGYNNLGKWADNQRQQYKLYKENKDCSMTKERIRAMENLGFKWRLLAPSSAPILVVVLPAEKTVADVNDKEPRQIEHEDDDEQMLEENKISSNSKNSKYDGDISFGDANIIEVPPAETIVVDVNSKEQQQIKHEDDDDQMLGENKTASSNNYDEDSSVGNANIYHTEQGDRDDEYYGSSDDDDDNDDLVF